MSETIKVDLRDGPKVETDNVTKVDLSKPTEVVTEEVATGEVATEDVTPVVEEVAADSERSNYYKRSCRTCCYSRSRKDY